MLNSILSAGIYAVLLMDASSVPMLSDCREISSQARHRLQRQTFSRDQIFPGEFYVNIIRQNFLISAKILL